MVTGEGNESRESNHEGKTKTKQEGTQTGDAQGNAGARRKV